MTLVACGSLDTPRAQVSTLPPHAVDVSAGVALAEHFEEWTTAIRVGEYVATQAFLASLYTPPKSDPAPVPNGPQSVGQSSHSDSWWRGVSSCEQGGQDNPFYGYFSVMDGSSAGLSWAQQVTLANGIIAEYGDSAWAAPCVAAGYAASPGG